jgi:hypothetical protein
MGCSEVQSQHLIVVVLQLHGPLRLHVEFFADPGQKFVGARHRTLPLLHPTLSPHVFVFYRACYLYDRRFPACRAQSSAPKLETRS